MICPHCQTKIHQHDSDDTVSPTNIHGLTTWRTISNFCPSCEKWTIDLVGIRQPNSKADSVRRFRAYPKSAAKPPAPPEVPTEFASDYNEASVILNDSPKASAALSRRCLQHVIHEKLGVKEKDLNKEIDKVLNDKLLPSHLAESVDAIRQIGNYAAHPNKTLASGEILEVEPGEAEWSLEVLEGLFDFLFVEPAKTAARKAALNSKLASAGKPPVKTPPT